MNDNLIKLLTGLLLFGLGVISTLLLKRIDTKKSRLQASSTEVMNLVNGWYNQLHEIYIEFDTANPLQPLPKSLFYVNNRLILPKLIYHLNILKKYKKAVEVVSLTETFLKEVTINYNPSQVECETSSENDIYECVVLPLLEQPESDSFFWNTKLTSTQSELTEELETIPYLMNKNEDFSELTCKPFFQPDLLTNKEKQLVSFTAILKNLDKIVQQLSIATARVE